MRYLSVLLLALTGWAHAQTPEESIREGLAVLDQRVGIESVEALGSGLFQVTLANGDQIYSVEGGKFLLTGDLYSVEGQELTNLTEQGRNQDRLAALEALNPAEVVSFAPESETRAVIYVFTDIDCGYCRKLHAEIEQYTERGIEIRYLAFPRAGVGSPSYDKYVSAYCGADQQASLTAAKAGASIPDASCANPIAAQFELGRAMGVTGTPSMILDNGQMVPGYVPAPELAAQLGL